MDIAPAVVTPELAAAALASPLLADAIKLADWIGAGKEVTGDGVLSPAMATLACELLDIEEAEEPDAGNGPLDGLWQVAQEAGLVTVDGELATAAALPADAEGVLSRWLRVALIPFGIPDEPCAECVTILALLAGPSEPVSVLTLLEAVLSDFPSGDEDEDEDADEEEDAEADEELVGHVSATVAGLRDLNAIAVTEFDDPEKDTLWLTPLGQMLASTVFAAITVAPDAMAAAVVRRIGEFTPRIAAEITGPWLAGRATVDVARELLDFAAYARADLRMIATAFVNTLGPDAAPAWRERAKDRRVGVYARAWLGEHGENVPMDGRDEDWMRAEEFDAYVAALAPPALVVLLTGLEQAEPGALTELQRVLNRSRHLDAPRLIDAIGQVTGRPAVAARRDPPPVPVTVTGTVYRLGISLRHVENPSVTRVVELDAGTTLADLREIIQAAMGWTGGHPHRFSFGSDEVDAAAPLGRLLRKPGDAILYTYDFGDGWEHEIILEDFHHNDGGDSLPVLLDGQGACPPGNPAEFSLASAAAAVSNSVSGAHPEHRPATVVRLQPRRKKRKH
jgi:hypothetical protein